MKNTWKNIALVASGIIMGTAIAGPVTQAAESIAAQRSEQKIYVDGQQVQMEAYGINGHNYVKLRDIGKAVGFNVSWDAVAKCVVVESDKPYSDEGAAQHTDAAVPVSGVVTLPTDGSKYTPKVGDRIPCDDGTTYEVKDVTRFENNVFASGSLPDLPTPECDWSLFEAQELPLPEVRHYVNDAGDNLFVRNIYETRRMQYTLYNAIGRTQESWRDGKPLAKVFLTIPAEYEEYAPVFCPWRASELEKHVANLPRGKFRVEAWDYYKNHEFIETRYYICTV